MTAKPKKTSPTWNNVKAKVVDFDRAGLLGLLQDLYAASKDNQAFLHARFGLGVDALEPYKSSSNVGCGPTCLKTSPRRFQRPGGRLQITRGLPWATGQSEGLAELMVFYCECAAGFSNSVGYEDEVYFNALRSMFEQALKLSVTLPVDQRDVLIDRLDDVRRISNDFGYGLGDDMNTLFAEYGVDD